MWYYFLCLKDLFDKMNEKAPTGFSIKVPIVFLVEWKNSHFKFLDRDLEPHKFLKLVLFQMDLIYKYFQDTFL